MGKICIIKENNNNIIFLSALMTLCTKCYGGTKVKTTQPRSSSLGFFPPLRVCVYGFICLICFDLLFTLMYFILP